MQERLSYYITAKKKKTLIVTLLTDTDTDTDSIRTRTRTRKRTRLQNKYWAIPVNENTPPIEEHFCSSP